MCTEKDDLQFQSRLLSVSLAESTTAIKGRGLLERLRKEIQQRKDAGVVCKSEKDCEGARQKCQRCWNWKEGKLVDLQE